MEINNKMKSCIESDSRGVSAVVDEDVHGTKAVPLVLVTKNAKGEFEYATSGGGGTSGTDGKSAYEIAVEAGFAGDENAWLVSLKGAKGDPGVKGTDGAKGDTGAPGKDGFGTQVQYNDIIARLQALEETP